MSSIPLICTDTVDEKYKGLLNQYTQRLNTLNHALSQSQDIEANMASMQAWLDSHERTMTQMESTPLIARTEPIQECVNTSKVRIIWDHTTPLLAQM